MNNSQYFIVVGTDYHSASELALERALELGAEKPDVDVHVLKVLAGEFDASPLNGDHVSAEAVPLVTGSGR